VATADGTHGRRWWTLAVLTLAVFMVGIDTTVLNVALPSLVRELGASTSQLQWITTAYSLVFAGLLLTAGSLGDRGSSRSPAAVILRWHRDLAARKWDYASRRRPGRPSTGTSLKTLIV
jgi:MFS family permease